MSMSGSGVEKNALNASGTAGTQASTAYNTVNPIYSRLATGTVGFTPEQKADMLSSSDQSLGGAVSGATGQGALYAARTGNAGGATAAIDDAARGAMQQQSQNALDVQNKDAALRTSNQRVGLEGLNGIYDNANKTGVDYLNTADSAAQARANRKLGWANLGAKVLGSASQAFQQGSGAGGGGGE